MKKDGVFCSYCMAHYKKLTAERNKDPVYISTETRSWKKAPECFKEQGERKCHTAALPYETVVPKCADPIEIHVTTITEKNTLQRQYLTIIMESLQRLRR